MSVFNSNYPNALFKRYTVTNTSFNAGTAPDFRMVLPGSSFMSLTNETTGTTVQISFDGVNVADELVYGQPTAATSFTNPPSYIWFKITNGSSASIVVRAR